MIKIISKHNENILSYLTNFEGLNFNKIQSLFRKKDIKVNKKRVTNDYWICIGDEILLYADYNEFFNIPVIYEDKNIVIVDKPKKIEVISENRSISLINLINPKFFAVHRLDFNTEGLVVIAKNEESKNILDECFKESKVNKEYATICKNVPKNENDIFEDYLLKNDCKVEISSKMKKDSKKIITEIQLLSKKKNYSLLKVSLKTGRTHQIRAHLAFHNLFILGDEKYGDFKTNKLLGLKTQILKCYKLSFDLENTKLSYLNGKLFETNIDRIKEYFNNL